jgi:hypothetical protein
MLYMLRWPDDFDDPRPVTGFDESLEIALVAFFDQMIASGATILANSTWMSFAISRGTRTVEFVRRGRHYWEVLLADGHGIRLGPIFGIGDSACVVVNGTAEARTVAEHWIDGSSIETLVKLVAFYDRMNPTQRLDTGS